MATFRRRGFNPPTVEAMQIKDPTGWDVLPRMGTWLVEDEHGRQEILTATEFKQRFERV